jgi:hypothetical protein
VKTQAHKNRYYFTFIKIMKQQFEALLTGSEMDVDGVVQKISFDGFDTAWEFTSMDNSLHLIIAQDDSGNWQRIAGTEPYLYSWTEELASQII